MNPPLVVDLRRFLFRRDLHAGHLRPQDPGLGGVHHRRLHQLPHGVARLPLRGRRRGRCRQRRPPRPEDGHQVDQVRWQLGIGQFRLQGIVRRNQFFIIMTRF